ncbi:MAG: hypothetical protein A2X82_01435 [Geobacteraceae bacterium GWC2_55_20]|nr:MAG: hypothetical protein A2X82_01435 [Geobacteraceae bacterium GWC2_55_20]OGU25856.1 MAG: hypothetical protein A2X85_16605 [Geobacteraceae bacterium GWF2_54_21]
MFDEQFPEWNNDDQQYSVKALKQWVVTNTQKQIDWYETRRKPRRLLAQGVRGLALILATLGALCPLLAPVVTINGLKLPELGYAFLAVGAALIPFDRYYGFSSSWMRFSSTQLSLEMLLREFQFDWILLQSQVFSAGTSIQKLKEFTGKVDGIIKQETDAWITDFKNNIAELEKMLKAGAEERKPGAIKLMIPNARDFQRISISVDGAFNKEMEGVTETLIDSISPGRHEVSLSTVDKSGSEHREAKVVDVTASTTVSVDVTIR